jgi:hypothetical protein
MFKDCDYISFQNMKIYFADSIRGGRDDQKLYFKIIEYLKAYGTPLTEHVCDPALTALGEKGPSENLYTRDMKWLEEADIVVAEVTTPSLGVGYEIAKAEDMKKPVLCLFRTSAGKSLSAMIGGNKNLTVANYETEDEIESILENFFKDRIGGRFGV